MRNYLRRKTGRLISKIKGEEYQLDPKIGIQDLLAFVLRRVITLLRGVFIGLFLTYKFPLFLFKDVKFTGRKHIKLGKGNTFYKGVQIHGLSIHGIVIGSNVSIGDYSLLRCTLVLKELGDGIKIGNHVGIGMRAFLGGFGGIEIGDRCIIAHDLSIHSDNHNFDQVNTSIKYQGSTKQKVVIESDCWLGANVTVLGGVTIGEGAVIGAGSIVTKDIPPYSVAVGAPAKVIKSRKGEAV